MIIDAHVHIFPEYICQERECYFDTEGAFELLYDSPRSRLVTAESLLAAMDEDGVDRSVVFGFPWKSSDTYRRHNDYIMECVARYPDRLVGFGCFDASHPAAPSEAERCMDAGLSGIGELAFYESGIDGDALDRLEPIMAVCRRHQCPVLVHTNEPVGHHYPGKAPIQPDQIYRMAARFPDIPIILAHWGGGLFIYHLLKKHAEDILKNVWYDTAASPYLYRPGIWSVAATAAGTDRILFGSDYPLIRPSRYFKDMAEGGLSHAQCRQIGGENAARLLGLVDKTLNQSRRVSSEWPP
ncbi:MAG: amidohydrolase family protein [Desulfobacterales bacterium]